LFPDKDPNRKRNPIQGRLDVARQGCKGRLTLQQTPEQNRCFAESDRGIGQKTWCYSMEIEHRAKGLSACLGRTDAMGFWPIRVAEIRWRGSLNVLIGAWRE